MPATPSVRRPVVLMRGQERTTARTGILPGRCQPSHEGSGGGPHGQIVRVRHKPAVPIRRCLRKRVLGRKFPSAGA